MYDRLLVAVDHSEVSPRVIAAAKDLALLSKGKVWVLHLLEKEVIAQMGDVPSESAQEADRAVREGVDALKQAGVDAEGEIRPTTFGHAAREILRDAPGVEVRDDPGAGVYPSPLEAAGLDVALVGRIRQVPNRETALVLFSCADNLRKGAALDAVQIAEHIFFR